MPEKVIHLVPSFHYDLEYLLSEGTYLEICFENLLEAHRLLSNHSEYTYRVEQVFLLEKFFAEYPSLVADFRRFAAEGRFEVAAGMYTMADLNIPSGESLIRQLVTGKEWCRRVLGIEPRVLDTGDCTGHPAQMPQIAAHCGYDYYVFERAIDDVQRRCEMRWRGIDGTVIPAYWLAVGGYAGWFVNGENDHTALTGLAARLNEHCLSRHRILAHGGDFQFPYEKGLGAVASWNRHHRGVCFRYSTYAGGFDTVDFARAPVETGEWNPDRQGCYSSRILLKQNNRECEALLYTAEAISAGAAVKTGLSADEEGLRRAWKFAFVNQFHDIAWGTICDAAYQHSLERAARIRTICRNIIEDRLQPLLDPGDTHRQILMFNPLPWPRSARVEVPFRNESGVPTVTGTEGVIETVGRSGRLRFTVRLPACGTASYTIVAASRPSRNAAGTAPRSKTRPGASFHYEYVKDAAGRGLKIRTPLYDVRFGPGGVIEKLRSRREELEYVDAQHPGFNVLCLQTDRGDLWQYYDGPLHDGGDCGSMQDLTRDPFPAGPAVTANGRRIYRDVLTNRGGQAEFEVVDSLSDELTVVIVGEFRISLQAFREFPNCGLHIEWTQRVTFRQDDPQIDFRLETRHLKGEWYRLRTAFMTDIKDGLIIHEIPFGRSRRPEGEFAAQTFLIYQGRNKGLVLLNRGLPGNNVTDGVIMLSLMRSVNIAGRTDSDQALEEGTTHSFDYALIPCGSPAALRDLDPARAGANFNCPPYVFDSGTDSSRARYQRRTGRAAAARPSEPAGLLQLESPGVACPAIYPSGDGIVLRLCETRGRKTKAAVKCSFRFGRARRVNALLEPVNKKIEVTRNSLCLNLQPYEIATVYLEHTSDDHSSKEPHVP